MGVLGMSALMTRLQQRRQGRSGRPTSLLACVWSEGSCGRGSSGRQRNRAVD
ncbi:hypothetical protein AZ78_1022 [Lysobacter capsici AZ78]|uniref:Uncharacterized protein n=1 Tax=Lysobacter capsici AZ78 TaxID=1444315 RepID=A0A108U6J2_9GAMM|nr:hypothetical protein AZ78_1022 [Lysobacter capsici AZ78]